MIDFGAWWEKHNRGVVGFTTPQINARPKNVKGSEKSPRDKKKVKRHEAASLPTRNYAYGAQTPTEHLDEGEKQIRLGYEYQCALVRIERERRDAVGQASLDRDHRYPELAALVQRSNDIVVEIELLRAEIKARNQQTRKRERWPEINEKIDVLRAELLALKGRKGTPPKLSAVEGKIYALRQKYKDDAAYLEALRDSTATAQAKAKAALAAAKEAGLYWPTYNAITRAADQAAKAIDSPRFPRFDGGGSIYYQIQTESGAEYLTPYEAHRCGSNHLQIHSTDHPKHFVAKVRIGSEGRLIPIWLSVPFKMHRPLPPDTYITNVIVSKKRVEARSVWQIVFTLARPAGWQKPRQATGKIIAVNLGWRIVPEGLRVAYWRDSAGNAGQIVFPHDGPCSEGRPPYTSLWSRIEELQSDRDKLFNEAIADLQRWKQGAQNLPDWFVEATASLPQWRSQGRLAGLVNRWRDNRFAGDEEIFGRMEQPPCGKNWQRYTGWRNKDKHLWTWQENLRNQVLAGRQHFYRVLAARWASEYDRVLLAKIDWTKLRRDPQPEEAQEEIAKLYRNIASCGELQKAIKEVAEVQWFPAANLTRTCHRCDHVQQRMNRGKRMHTCENEPCGKTWDLDDNHCRNLLASGDVVDKSPGTARGDEESAA